MPSITLTVKNAVGLHARPAAVFVKTAKEFPCTITVRNLTSSRPPANAKSPLGVLTQVVQRGHQILIEAEGESADAALAALQQLVDNDFGEGDSHG
jgi:phosphotransferase system HPr (HPr) family protein